MACSSSFMKHEARYQDRGGFNGRKDGETPRARVVPKRDEHTASTRRACGVFTCLLATTASQYPSGSPGLHRHKYTMSSLLDCALASRPTEADCSSLSSSSAPAGCASSSSGGLGLPSCCGDDPL